MVEFVLANAYAFECSFCPAKSDVPIAADIDEVSAHFMESLFREYDLAVNALPWEGGYMGPHWDADELAFSELEWEFPKDNHELLLPHLFGEYYEESWCQRDPYGPDDSERTEYSWDRFCHIVKHERRYFFLGRRQDSIDLDTYSPREVLSQVFDYAQQMGLIKSLPAGTQLARARWEGKESLYETPEELGPPPEEMAIQSNRMSPAGIPMFYACAEQETALKETASGPGRFAVGVFETLKQLSVLDLTEIPDIPGLFERVPDSAEVDPRTALIFLHHVAGEISRPIDRGDRVHIQYVPTQVVTEYIRDQLTWGNRPVNGISYLSSVHRGHVSYVLFAVQDNVKSTRSRPQEDLWLRLIHVNHRDH